MRRRRDCIGERFYTGRLRAVDGCEVMALLKYKAGVVVSRQAIIAAAVINAANVLGIKKDITVTSGNDSKHKSDSKHYTNEALDIRTKNLTANEKHALHTAVQARLGKHYQVFLEFEHGPQEHLHIEFDPRHAPLVPNA